MAEYIEKQAVMNKFAEVVAPSNNSDFERVPSWNDAVGIIEGFPPADVRPAVRGRWRKIGNNSDGTSDYECSACLGIMMNVPDDDEHPLVSFCSMCGADMRGGDADGDEKD